MCRVIVSKIECGFEVKEFDAEQWVISVTTEGVAEEIAASAIK